VERNSWLSASHMVRVCVCVCVSKGCDLHINPRTGGVEVRIDVVACVNSPFSSASFYLFGSSPPPPRETFPGRGCRLLSRRSCGVLQALNTLIFSYKKCRQAGFLLNTFFSSSILCGRMEGTQNREDDERWSKRGLLDEDRACGSMRDNNATRALDR